jgi:hypothetical protein
VRDLVAAEHQQHLDAAAGGNGQCPGQGGELGVDGTPGLIRTVGS